MSLIPWSNKKNASVIPFSRDFFNKFLDTSFAFSESMKKSFPTIDISEDENKVTVKAEIPGMSEEDIELTFHDGILSISGEKTEEKEEKNKNTYYKESFYGSFSRSIPLENVDWEKVLAKYKHGALTITLPKLETVKSNKVKIKIES